jgi:hypothetical protein
MSSSVEELCRALVTAFSEGRLDRLSDHYTYPLAIYLPHGVRIEMTPDQTVAAVKARRKAALRAGLGSVRLTIASVTETPQGRITVGLSWEFLDEAGGRIDRSVMRYYCRRWPEGAVRVEMIEFTEIAFAEALPED